MSHLRKTPGTSSTRGVVYDLAERRRRMKSVDGGPPGAGEADASDLQRPGAVDAPPELRAERVARLKAQIADGTYNPDPMEVARKLLERGF
jgi:flagellar biosynthesis anti-sigma factor FlgM